MKCLNRQGLRTLLALIDNIFCSKKHLKDAKNRTDGFIFNIDYSLLAFDTSAGEGAASPVIGVGQVNSMIIAKS